MIPGHPDDAVSVPPAIAFETLSRTDAAPLCDPYDAGDSLTHSVPPAGTRAGSPPGQPTVTRIGEHEIHALAFGEGAPTILLLHGLSGSSRWWSRNVPGLAEAHRVLVPDLIGYGRSRIRGALPEIRAIADLLVDWLDVVSPGPIAVVGHSMGGQIAIHMAARYPARIDRLVLADAAGIPRELSLRSFMRLAAEIAPVWRWGDPSFLPIIAGDAWTAGPLVLLRTVRNILSDDVRPLLSRVEAPTLLIWGERDSLVPLSDAWEFRNRIPSARLAVLRGAAHNSMVDRPEAFNRLVRRFLDGEPVGR